MGILHPEAALWYWSAIITILVVLYIRDRNIR